MCAITYIAENCCMALAPIRILRKGQFSTLFEVKRKESSLSTEKSIVVYLGRVLERQPSQSDLEIYCRRLKDICHANIVKFMGCFIDEELPVFVMENMNIPLDDLLMKENPSLECKLSILLDIARSLEYLHDDKRKVIHGMVVACNVYIDKSKTAKLAYLENAITRDLDEDHPRRQSIGSRKYMPPEITGTKFEYTTSVDIFSFGHLSIYTINQKLPELNQSGATESEKRRSHLNEMKTKLEEDRFGMKAEIIERCLSNRKEKRYIIILCIM